MTPSTEMDSIYLKKALELALIRKGFCAPNPAVGALIVQGDKIIASGNHYGAGAPHAEVEALDQVTGPLTEACLYVTLEPCNHTGRTPPCTQAIIQSGLRRIVFGYQDPDSRVAGQGQKALIAAGISCTQFFLPEIVEFYSSYAHWQRTKKPFVTAKIAMTLDQKIAAENGEPLCITGVQIAQFTHQRRKESDGILTTVKTITADDPQLNARVGTDIFLKPLYVLDRDLSLSTSARIFMTAKSLTLFHDKKACKARKKALGALGVRCVPINSTPTGKLDLKQVIAEIGQDGVHALWIEAGGECFTAFIQEKLLQQAYIYISPHSVGKGTSAFTTPLDFREANISWKQLGKDVLCHIRW